MSTAEFRKKTSDLEIMTGRRKTEIIEAMRLGVEVPLADLAALSNLEVRIEARQAFARIAEMTIEDEEEDVDVDDPAEVVDG